MALKKNCLIKQIRLNKMIFILILICHQGNNSLYKNSLAKLCMEVRCSLRQKIKVSTKWLLWNWFAKQFRDQVLINTLASWSIPHLLPALESRIFSKYPISFLPSRIGGGHPRTCYLNLPTGICFSWNGLWTHRNPVYTYHSWPQTISHSLSDSIDFWISPINGSYNIWPVASGFFHPGCFRGTFLEQHWGFVQE